ncbi:acetyl-CoA C-acyltransferase [Acetobacter pasteurianus]|uniref:acetyl-CoA C-acyltransferase n=1 Tax=Lodderomyces elongisporus (strain ATCC 11503 / CBS 2605 / JCM 1781 / NBRC 1676 / NRRL YB-4239) TaxID=379508 RepID=A5DXV8_LODEL|nr:3-ketoacyl-CoA thiolase A, peroxisomal [Lodderomyces elongisporus]EDK44016.1 3-ketoacyl-CoA thiolase B [Lodderomyces elongisporus NRRL YB-4239]MDC6271789.1 acetyl-CoA C-acyltransferase [Acetobacter pasteurianus]WLF78481.1 3-ketoacyl-CoA thiolase A, peroxisomal [Lodderomyces elongisporus]
MSVKDQYRQKNPDDVVIVAAYRTALTKGGKGGFKDVKSDFILRQLAHEFIKKTNLDPKLVQDIAIGNVLHARGGDFEHRAALMSAGFPHTSPFIAINRLCSSGLMAISQVANKIRVGEIECGIGGGVESMTKDYGPQALVQIDPAYAENEEFKKTQIPMGITNENVCEKFNIKRDVQDQFAASSYNKAEKAQKEGRFKDEILPIEVYQEDDDDDDDDENEDDDDDEPKEKKVWVSEDEGIRPGVTAEKLGKIKPAFKENGSSSAGNSSQVTDGAALVLLMKRSFAEKNGYKPVAKYLQCSICGVPPEIMGIGPAVAIPKVLKQLDLKVDDIDVYEINEAFAGQCLYSIESCGIPQEKVNKNGGAIALGHPMGCTGARQYATILRLLEPGQFGLTSMCIGTGMGAASVIIKE